MSIKQYKDPTKSPVWLALGREKQSELVNIFKKYQEPKKYDSLSVMIELEAKIHHVLGVDTEVIPQGDIIERLKGCLGVKDVLGVQLPEYRLRKTKLSESTYIGKGGIYDHIADYVLKYEIIESAIEKEAHIKTLPKTHNR